MLNLIGRFTNLVNAIDMLAEVKLLDALFNFATPTRKLKRKSELELHIILADARLDGLNVDRFEKGVRTLITLSKGCALQI